MDVVDLNALAPEPRTIRIGSPAKDIVIQPPKTINVLKLAALGQEMQNIAGLTPDETEALITRLQSAIVANIPELESQSLNTAQLLKLLEIIMEMAMPEQADELKKRKITAADSKKNQPS